MFKYFENFIYPSKENFPEKECVVQSENEPNIFDGTNLYLVLYIDIRFSSEKHLTFATPYICKDSDGEITYGWSSKHNEVFGNIENSCQLWDEFVIGFLPMTEDEIREDEKIFKEYVDKVNTQYD